MYHRMEDFYRAFEGHRASTNRVLEAARDQSLSRSVGDYRTLGQVAWHIVTTVPEMMNQLGLGLSSVDAASPPPTSAAAIREGYEAVTRELVAALEATWTDETLAQSDVLYGETWARGLTLKILMDHEIHHRGQMTVLLRLLGEKVPGIYGPSREEWSAYGQEAPAY